MRSSDKVCLPACTALLIPCHAFGRALPVQVDSHRAVDGDHPFISRDNARIIRVRERYAVHIRIFIQKAIELFIAQRERIDVFAIQKPLVFVGYIAVFYQSQHRLIEELSVDTQIIFFFEAVTDGRRDIPQSQLQGGAVRNLLQNQRGKLFRDLVAFRHVIALERSIYLHQRVCLGHVNQMMLAQHIRHLPVYLQDYGSRRFFDVLSAGDAGSSVRKVSVFVRRGNLKKGHIRLRGFL